MKFRSSYAYAVKIYAGGVNVVSGGSLNDLTATIRGRHGPLSDGKSTQDYVVLPHQPWIDGIATESGNTRQFVAMPMGPGQSDEAQMSGMETTTELRFEITPAKPYKMSVTVRYAVPFGTDLSIEAMSNELLGSFRARIGLAEGDTLALATGVRLEGTFPYSTLCIQTMF
jgi:hypothetical protein